MLCIKAFYTNSSFHVMFAEESPEQHIAIIKLECDKSMPNCG